LAIGLQSSYRRIGYECAVCGYPPQPAARRETERYSGRKAGDFLRSDSVCSRGRGVLAFCVGERQSVDLPVGVACGAIDPRDGGKLRGHGCHRLGNWAGRLTPHGASDLLEWYRLFRGGGLGRPCGHVDSEPSSRRPNRSGERKHNGRGLPVEPHSRCDSDSHRSGD
jgi:hypothetical protein